MDDITWMRHCLALAERAVGHTSPNPMVGAVIVDADGLVAEGWHERPGTAHAEVVALRQARDRSQGATLYVNLEPCNHTGRTPPCTEAIIAAGIRRVVVGMVDPNPLVAGQGVAHLRAAGLTVDVGVLEADCQQLNEAFSFSIVQQRAFGLWKYAMTLDGKTAAVTGDSRWISGIAARAWVHQQRSRVDAVVIGGQTVRQDDPQLTCRHVAGRNPLRVVLSHRLNLPRNAQLWHIEEAPTLVYCEAPDPLMANYLTARGVEVIVLDELSPRVVAADLYQRGKMQILWECGGTLAAEAIASGAIQKVAAIVAPKLIGGEAAPTPLEGQGIPLMQEALAIINTQWQLLGDDVLLTGYLAPRPEETQEIG